MKRIENKNIIHLFFEEDCIAWSVIGTAMHGVMLWLRLLLPNIAQMHRSYKRLKRKLREEKRDLSRFIIMNIGQIIPLQKNTK
jgi:hypothetical protein